MSISPQNPAIDYDKLVREYEDGLVNNLRSFGIGGDGIALWVPDNNLCRSLGNLIESLRTSGKSQFAIRIGLTHLKDMNAAALAKALPAVFNAAVDPDEGGGVIVSISPDPKASTATTQALADPAGRRAESRRLERVAVANHKPAKAGVLPRQPEAIGPLYAAKLKPYLGKDGASLPEDAQGSQCLRAEMDELLLVCLCSQDGVIAKAGFSGARSPVLQAVMVALTGLLPGLTVQEAADHGAIHLEGRLRETITARPVPGIVLPVCADPMFAWIEALLRRLRAGWSNSSTLNLYDLALSADWLAMTPAERMAKVAPVVADLAREQGLPDGAMVVVSADDLHPTRISLQLPSVHADEQYRLLILAERAMRKKVDPRLEVFVEELKDKNKSRRLK